MKGPGFGDMMKNLQRAQTELARLAEEMAERTVEATAGGGAVRAVVNGRRELVQLEIDPKAVDPEDVEMLQDLVMAAVNEGLRQVEEVVAKEVARVTGFRPPGI